MICTIAYILQINLAHMIRKRGKMYVVIRGDTA
jgi:hypothetical protein